MATLNTVEYNQATRQMFPLNLTASLATTASYALSSGSITNAISASYALTASYAVNGGGGAGTSFYNTLTSSSLNWITMSFANSENYFALTNGFNYNFTHSNLPTAPTVQGCSLLIVNTAAATSSLSFPSSWTFMGSIPTSLTGSKNAILSLKAYGNSPIIAGFSVQY